MLSHWAIYEAFNLHEITYRYVIDYSILVREKIWINLDSVKVGGDIFDFSVCLPRCWYERILSILIFFSFSSCISIFYILTSLLQATSSYGPAREQEHACHETEYVQIKANELEKLRFESAEFEKKLKCSEEKRRKLESQVRLNTLSVWGDTVSISFWIIQPKHFHSR